MDLFLIRNPVENIIDYNVTSTPLEHSFLGFEASFDLNYWRKFMGKWWSVSIYISVLYVFLIFWGKRFMSTRPPFELTYVTLFWNLFLAVLSFSGCLRALPEVIRLFTANGVSKGFHQTVCTWEDHSSAVAFWGWLYTLSKCMELLGTFLIILKKRELLFLHYFHHTTAFLYCFYIYESYDSTMRWFGVTNSFVHGVVYSFLVLKGLGQILGFKIPRSWAVRMTTLQIIEMFGGIAVNLYTLKAKESEKGCARELENIYLTLAIYACFAVLFVHYFYNSYLAGRKRKEKKYD